MAKFSICFDMGKRKSEIEKLNQTTTSETIEFIHIRFRWSRKVALDKDDLTVSNKVAAIPW